MASNSGQLRRNNHPSSVKLLQKLENGLDAFMDASVDAFLLFDDNLDLMSINPAGERLFGVSKEMVVGANIVKLEPGIKETEKYGKYLDVMKTGGLFFVEEPFSHPKFGDMHLNIKAFKMRKGLGMIVNDITEQRKMEEALRESELLATATIEGMSDGVVLVGMDGKVAYVNKAFEKMLGYKIEELVGTSAVELPTYHGSKDKKKTRRALKMVIEKGSAEPIDMVALTKDGEEIPISFSASLIKDAKGYPKTLVAVIRDVTERKKAEETLRESEKRLRDIAENSREWIWEADTKGKYTYSSPIVESILGYTSEEILEKHFYDLFHPDDRENLKQVALEAFARKESFHELVNRNVSKDGKTVWLSTSGIPLLDNAGNLMGYRGSDVDITERKKAKEALKESEERYRRLVDNAQDIIFRFSADKGLEYVSPAVSTIMGYSAEELRGNPELALGLATVKDEKVAKDYQEVISEGKSMRTRDITAIRKDGKQVYLDMRSQAVRDKDGNVVAFEGILRDITERKQMEEEVRLLSDAVRMTTDSVAITDISGRVLDINEAGLRMYGLSDRADFVGKNPLDAIAPEDRRKAIENMAKIMETGQVKDIEYHVLRKDGSKILIETSVSVIREDNGEPKGLVAVARDITERRRMEEALRQSEARYRLLADNVEDVISTMDMDAKTTFVSPSVTQLTGFSVEETMAHTLEEALTPPSQSLVRNAIAEGKAGAKRGQWDLAKSAVLELGLICKDGAIVPVEAKTTLLFGADGKPAGVLGVLRDIRERRKAEENLRLRENAIDNSLSAIAMSDMQGMITYVNKACLRLWGGGSREELVGKPTWILLKPKEAAIAIEMATAMLEKQAWEGDLSGINKDGKEMYVHVASNLVNDEKGNPIQTVTSFINMTERKKAEDALRRSELNYRVLFESMMEGVLVLDAETMKVVLANRTAMSIGGFDSVSDVIGVSLFDYIHPDDRERVVGAIAEDVFGEESYGTEEFRIVTKDGKEKWVSRTGTKTEYEGKLAVLLSVVDITERKRREEEKKRMEEQLRLVGRLAAVGELAAGVAHELNNPLAAIQGYSQFLSSSSNLDEATKKDLETIYKEALRASKITQNLLSFARRHEPEKKFISLNEVIENTIELRAHPLKVSNIDLVTELAPDLPKTMADFYQLQQVFVNLTNNAEQAMAGAHGRGRLVVRSKKTDGMIQISFTDDGPGIPEENLKRIFDPFFTTKEVGKGTGLGLSICFGIVEAHGGQLYAQSKLGEGATFIVEIPIVAERK